LNRWFYWNDHFWREDKINQVTAEIKELIEVYNNEMQYQQACLENNEKRNRDVEARANNLKIKKLKSKINALQKVSHTKNVLTFAISGVNTLGKTGNMWDLDPWILGCRNGVIDLKTGNFRPGDPQDYIKRVCPTKFEGIDPQKVPCQTWINFLYDVFNGDSEIVEYIQRLLGYGITGLTTEDIYPILWGPKGRNGKSTLLETIKFVLGDLAYKTPAALFIQQNQQQSSNAPNAELAAFQGARIVWGSETNEGDRLDVCKIKELTGSDTISCRPPYAKDQIQFKPTHLLLLLTNQRPKVPANDQAIWRRIHLIQFHISFVHDPDPAKPNERKIDLKLSERLKAEAPGILAWLIRGCLKWQEEGLNPPKSICDETNEYKIREDIIGDFIAERCIEAEGLSETPKNLYDAYKVWCLDVGHKSLAKKRFIEDMKERFVFKKNVVRVFDGICLQ